ncbi:MAG: CoA transferase [Burkholderiaceae bacterium]|nr:CoA transferase [Burkholderiaceae bacterium]
MVLDRHTAPGAAGGFANWRSRRTSWSRTSDLGNEAPRPRLRDTRTRQPASRTARSVFGQTGPMSRAPAYAPIIHAASGLATPTPAIRATLSRPANNGIFIADVLGAINAASAIQTALLQRYRTGRGQCVDVSLMDSVLEARS